MPPCMTSILAFSVTDKIEQYGAYAGFASVLGLAVLSLLYFAQAREVKRLREWAGRSPERAAEQQERAVAAAQQRAVVAPQRPGAPGVGGTVSPAAAPGAPRPAAATPAGQAASGVGGAGSAAAAAATAAGAAGTATPAAAAGQPTTAMPAANGAAAASPPPTPAATPPARPGQPLRVPPNGPAGSTAARLQDPDDDEPRSRTGLFAAIGAIVVVLIVGGLLLSGVFSGDDTGTQPESTVPGSAAETKTTKTTKTKPGTTPSSAPKPGTYTVAVLNGTTVPGLARGVANRLQNTKYKIGNVTNAATQDRSATLVEFAQGHRAEADQVAKAIDVGSDSIQPLSAGSKTIAGDAATVVVTVGSDQNVSPQQTGTTG